MIQRGTNTLTARPVAQDHDLFSNREWMDVARELKLSGRELDIVRLCVADLKEATIARRLSISEHTVHTHMERLRRKLGVGSRAALLVRIFAASRTLTRP